MTTTETKGGLTMQEALDRFASEYQSYHGLSTTRRGLQLAELRKLAEFAGRAAPQDCDANDMRSYLAHLVDKGLHVNTVRWRHGMLGPFYTWGYQAGIVTADQLMGIKLVENPKGSSSQSEPKPYSSKELKQFWTDLDARLPIDPRFHYWMERHLAGRSRYKRVGVTVMRYQMEAIFALALEGGLRKTEIFTAQIDHIHPDNASIIVPQRGERATGKDKYREVPYTRPARDAIYRWLQVRAQLGVAHDSPWIIGWFNRPEAEVLNAPSRTGFSNLPSRIGKWEYHRFRHTCATLWLRSGMKLELVQRVLGHSNLQQTLAYAKIVADDIEASVEANEDKFRQLTRRDR